MKLIKYLFEYLAEPRKELDGHAVCPFIAQYQDQIQVVKTEDWQLSGENACKMMDFIGLVAIVIHGPAIEYDDLHDLAQKLNKKYKSKDREVLFMHPNTEQPPLPLQYNYHKPLLIVQKRSVLQSARKTLAKDTNYYDFWDLE